MEEKGILKHWILPEQGLNKGTNCNRAIHCAVLEHISHTATLQTTDKQKFTVSMPKRQDYAYLRLWDPSFQLSHPMGWEAGVPSLKQILEDIDCTPNYLILKQIEARGAVVHGCGTHRGLREDGKYKAGKCGSSRLKKM
eukprot:14353930-Ditylum_brightwellii.AAC.1